MSGYGDTRDPGVIQPEAIAPDDDAALDALFQTWMVALTGLPGDLVRPRFQPAQPPMPPQDVNWCALGVLSQTSDDNEWMGHNPAGDEGLGNSQMQRHEDLEVLASFYGPRASGYAGMVRDTSQVDQNNDMLAAHGIVFVGNGRMQLVPELIGQLWVRRSDLLLQFRRQVTRIYPIRTILSVPTNTSLDPT